jgi:WS/DGAT/MGAT family acyltransferase
VRCYLSGVDSGFWHIDSPATPQAIGAFCPLDRMPEEPALLSAVEDLARWFPRLRQRVEDEGELFWEDDPGFQAANHLDLRRGEVIESDRLFLDTVAKAFAEPTRRDRPPWRLVVWAAPRNSSRWLAGFLFTFHHSLADGLAGVMMLEHLLRDGNGEKIGPPRSIAPGAGPDPAEAGPLRKNSGALNGAIKLVRQRLANTQQPGLKGENSAERHLVIADLELAELKQLARKHGSSVNDLYLAAAVSAVGGYLRETGQRPGEAKVILPVSIRQKWQRFELGNQLLAVSLPVSLAPCSAAERLKQIRERTAEAKSGKNLAAYESLARSGAWLPRRLKAAVANFLLSGADFICTNMPGPPGPRFLGEAKLLGMYGMPALVKKHGLAFSAMSCAGKMCFSITSDPKIVAAPERLLEIFLEQMGELKSGR